MTDSQIALLALLAVGGIGLIIVIAGVLIKIIATKKNAACTMMTTGVVIKHKFAGGGRFYPVVAFKVNGKSYTTKKKFNGIIRVQRTGLLIPTNNAAWEDDKGYLHVKTGPIANMRLLAEQLWPLGSQINVFYDPRNPNKNYVERPISNIFVSRAFLFAGLGTILLAVLVFYLMQL